MGGTFYVYYHRFDYQETIICHHKCVRLDICVFTCSMIKTLGIEWIVNYKHFILTYDR